MSDESPDVTSVMSPITSNESLSSSILAESYAAENADNLEAYAAEFGDDEDFDLDDDDSDDVEIEVEEVAPVKAKPKAASTSSKSSIAKAVIAKAFEDEELADEDDMDDEEEVVVPVAKKVSKKQAAKAAAAAGEVSVDGATPAEVVNGFEQFGLSDLVMKSLKKIGYTAPTPVQLQCLPLLLEEREGNGRDLVALARTGTGKTAAFGIPIIERIEASIRKPQALVLCPTRELCQQVATSLGQIGDAKRIRVLSIYGGDSYRRQFEGIQSGPHIIVATPGRLIDMLTRKALDLTSIRTLVLDEADEMISVGFREALDQILQSFAAKSATAQDPNRDEAAEPHCTWLFSATMSADIKRVQSRYIKNAKMVDARGQEEKTLIRQQYMLTFEEDRLEALKRYLHVNENFYGLIFCQTKAEVAETEAALKHEGFKVDSLHGDKVQRDREAVFAAWKKKTIKIVIATDVAARGLDVKGLTHVVNMSIPREDESYVHRIGRTGRAGQEGIALSFVWPKRMGILRQLERKLGVQLEHIAVPEPGDIARAVLGREVEALFKTPLEFKAENTSHKMIAELIQEQQPVSEEVLPMLSALAARILEKKNPALLSRPTIKALRADAGPSPYAGNGGGGRYERGGGGGYDRGGRGGYDRGGDRGGRPSYGRDRGGYEPRGGGYDRGGFGGGRPEGRPAGRIEARGEGRGIEAGPRGFDSAPRGRGIEARSEAPRGGGFDSAPRGEFRRPQTRGDGPKFERSYTRPSREGDDSRTTADVAPRLRDRAVSTRGESGGAPMRKRSEDTGGGFAPKRRGPWEKR